MLLSRCATLGRLAALSALLSFPTPSWAGRGEVISVDERMAPPQLCKNLKQVSLRKVEKEQSPFDPSSAHDRLNGQLPTVGADAPIVIKMLAGGGMSAYGPAGLESVIAWRNEDGQWHARRAEEESRFPEPELPLPPLWPNPAPKPAVEGHLPAPSRLSVSEGPLPADRAELLERALHPQSCLGLEPQRLPLTLPLRDGSTAPCVPDSASWHVEIRTEAGVRRFARPCRLLGPVGLIAWTLDLAPLPPARLIRSRSNLYNGDPQASISSLQQFLTAKLPGVRYRDSEGEGDVRSIRHISRCESEMEVEYAARGIRRVHLDWRTPTSYPMWISDGVVRLGPVDRTTGLDAPGARFWIASGTTLALQLQGALWNLSRCEP